jgi:hypothetical protein
MENLPFQPYSFKKKKKIINTALSPFYKPAAEVTFKSCLLFKLVKALYVCWKVVFFWKVNSGKVNYFPMFDGVSWKTLSSVCLCHRK